MTRIFISYRRKDSEVIAGRIYDRLTAVFGANKVFKDVDDIPPGVDFRDVLRHKLARSDVVLAVIGPLWVDVRDAAGRRRLDDPGDYTRIEVEQALGNKSLLVIPTLVQGASMPHASELPESLLDLTFRNAIHVRNDPDFNRDVERLCQHIKKGKRRRRGRTARSFVRLVGSILLLTVIAAVLLQVAPPIIDEITSAISAAAETRENSSSSGAPAGSDRAQVHEVIVDSRADWFDTGIRVERGHIMSFDTSGEVNIWPSCPDDKWEYDLGFINCNSCLMGPDGGLLRWQSGEIFESDISPDTPDPDLPLHSLIGRVGMFTFEIGSHAELRAPANGTINLIVNDWLREDNAGDFIVRIEIEE